MVKNIGSIDKLLRVGLSLLFVGMIVVGSVEGTAAIILGVLAGVFLVTSATGFCPLYSLLHKSTLGKQ